ncbi:bifunctional precorrin-2 dehydrogenase/sirohydrochlorin ferrochelatase [Paenibacillus sp. HJGM_3]|uniref:precorrin-2 dehydrogenase/sirohydrochlorin ferrochelatase family protein n=1 Tax=Paenibacillus sp. HJGM_3 TaxID=3379816 RepID=UPI0038593741
MSDYPALPMQVRLAGRPCLVVGGGRVAERKIAVLLEAGAAVHVVSPDVSDRVQAWIDAGAVTASRRAYATEDGEGAFLLVAATDQAAVNARVAADGAARGQLVNAAASPELGSVTLPAVLRRGRLVVAVSTTGASPAAAAAIRDRIAALLGDEAERLLEFLERFRREALARVPDAARRRELLRDAMRGDVFARLAAEGWDAYERDMLARLEAAAK